VPFGSRATADLALTSSFPPPPYTVVFRDLTEKSKSQKMPFLLNTEKTNLQKSIQSLHVDHDVVGAGDVRWRMTISDDFYLPVFRSGVLDNLNRRTSVREPQLIHSQYLFQIIEIFWFDEEIRSAVERFGPIMEVISLLCVGDIKGHFEIFPQQTSKMGSSDVNPVL
jgi:hypothetical protein